MASSQNRFKRKNLKSDSPETKDQSRPNESKATQFQYVSLSLIESLFYWTTWFSIVGYMMCKVIQASNNYKEDLYPEDFDKGWKIIGREKDATDVEWEFWSNLKLVLLASFSLHSLGGFVISKFIPELKAWFYLVYTLVFLGYVLGILPVLYMLVQCLVMYLAALTQSVLLVWGAALSILGTLQMDNIRQWQYQYLTNKTEHRDLILFVSLMSLLRSISFSLDFCFHKMNQDEEDESPSYSFFNHLSFNFYLPLFNNGPVMTFNTFYKQFHQPHRSFTREEILSILWDSLRTICWFVFLEVYLHYVYSSALTREAPVFKALSDWTLAGVLYSQLHIFLTKYVVLYRFSGIFARFDQLDPPRAPRCVSTLYTYTDMWRYFDRGLNCWMKRYIYVPMGGSRRGVFRQVLGSFLAFGFIWAWHGANRDTLWWFIPNWLGVAVEGIAASLAVLPLVKNLEDLLSSRMRRRVRAVFCTITCASLILSNMVFLIGSQPVAFFINRIFYQGFPVSSLVCMTTLYITIQTSIDINNYKDSKW